MHCPAKILPHRDASRVSECGFPLLNERRHALLLVLCCKGRVEDAALKANTLGERHLKRSIDGLLSHGNDRLAVRGNLRAHGDGNVDGRRCRDYLGDEPGRERVLRRQTVSCQNELHGLRLADRADEALRATATRDGSDGNLWGGTIGVTKK